MPAETITAPKREVSRHVTADGRNSLFKHFFGPRAGGQTAFGLWFNRVVKKETAPLFAAVVGGAALAGWFGVRHLATSPDVRVDKVQRQQSVRKNFQEGENWVKHHASMRGLSAAHVPPKQPAA